MKALVVVDMQNDFIDGALGTKEAQEIVPYVKSKIENFCGEVIFTRDTHEGDYLSTQEGVNLPVPHCIRGTHGWEIAPALSELVGSYVVDKPTFGSFALVELLKGMDKKEPIEEIELVGLCTDICVISNAMLLKAAFLDARVVVDSVGCAGVSVQSHNNALEAMKMCQIIIK